MEAIHLHSGEGWSKISWKPDTTTPVALRLLRAFIWHLTEGYPLQRVKKLYQTLTLSLHPLNPANRRQFYSWIDAKELPELLAVPEMVHCEQFTGLSHPTDRENRCEVTVLPLPVFSREEEGRGQHRCRQSK